MDNSRREEWQGGPGPAEQVEEHQQQNQPPSQPLFGYVINHLTSFAHSNYISQKPYTIRDVIMYLGSGSRDLS